MRLNSTCLSLTYFTSHNALKVHLRCHRWQDFHFLGWVISHCVYIFTTFCFTETFPSFSLHTQGNFKCSLFQSWLVWGFPLPALPILGTPFATLLPSCELRGCQQLPSVWPAHTEQVCSSLADFSDTLSTSLPLLLSLLSWLLMTSAVLSPQSFSFPSSLHPAMCIKYKCGCMCPLV